MIFNIDSDMVLDSIEQVLIDAGAEMSQEKFNTIVEKIEDSMPGVIQILAERTAEMWKVEAITAGGWGTKYAKAIKYDVEDTHAEIYLDEDLVDKESNKPNFMFAMMMEKGVKSWSIKEALLASGKAKTGKDGIKYIIVPFPVRTPKTSGSGKTKSYFGRREMSTEMHDLVKNGGRVKSGALDNGKDISGLTQYNTRQFHSQYGMFRCVSSKSQGWIYPDIPAEPIYANVLKDINAKIQEAISAFCKAIVEEYSK